MTRLKDPEAVRKIARKSLFEGLDQMCEGAIVVDREARVVWLSDKYAAKLKLANAAEAVGRVVEDVIPNSLMREIVRTGEPQMLDIMQFGDESFVVMRVPIKDERGRVIGAAGFMLFGGLRSLDPIVGKGRTPADLESAWPAWVARHDSTPSRRRWRPSPPPRRRFWIWSASTARR